jgi:hypothetical protein
MIIDEKESHVLTKSRADFMIVRKEIGEQKKLVQLKEAIVHIEVKSGGKSDEASIEQLSLNLLSISHEHDKEILYGVVIDPEFTNAFFTKVFKKKRFRDGSFHPSRIDEVAQMIEQERLQMIEQEGLQIYGFDDEL